MSKQSSENYLDQLLHSMNVKTNRTKDKQVQDLEKEIESVKQTLRTRDENSFYDELEADLGNDEYRQFVSDFEAELDGYEPAPKTFKNKEEKTPKKEPKPIKEIEPEPIKEEIPEGLDTLEALFEQSAEPIEEVLPTKAETLEKLFEESVPSIEEALPEKAETLEELFEESVQPIEEAIPQQRETLEELPIEDVSEADEIGAVSLEDLVLEEIKEEDIQVQEPIVQDLSGLSEAELDKLLEEDADFEDIEHLLSGETQTEGATDFEAFAQNEMPGVIELEEGVDLDELIPDVSKKKESFFDKIKKLFSKKGKEDEKVNLAFGGTDVNALADENQEILDAFEKAEGKGAGKKPKKEKSKKEKKKKEKVKQPKPKKEKKPKQPKPKKEKKPKEIDTTPPLPKKPVILIWVFVISLLALVILLTNLVSYSMNIKQAKECFDEGDYSAALGELNGLSIKEKDLELYNQISALAPIDSEWDAYVVFTSYGKKVEALDSLVCAAGRCEVNRENAILCNAEEAINQLVEKITKELMEKYGITYEEAIEVYYSFDREEYSIRMNAILKNLGLIGEE